MPTMPSPRKDIDYHQLPAQINQWAAELGFQQVGITDINLDSHEDHLHKWLAEGFHGEMHYMHKHGSKRTRPDELVANTRRVISVRMDYHPPDCELSDKVLQAPEQGFISRYALGRDYHKVMRKRLQKLAEKIQAEVGDFGYRAFVDSAPVMEKALAEKAGLGWIGKHSNLINNKAGSWFFLGEIYTDLPLPVTNSQIDNHCGTCRTCIDICPTQAIIAPYQVDARRCISYLTIELRGSIPVEFRRNMGNRIYGCDDCQLCCPWNRFSTPTREIDFFTRHPLDAPDLLTLFGWSEDIFLKNTEGSPIRRIGYACWLRNISIALGNQLANLSTKNSDDRYQSETEIILAALSAKKQLLSTGYLTDNQENTAMLAEHFDWALKQAEQT